MTQLSPTPIRTVIVGVGNCASSLIQGVSYCRALGDKAIGVSFPDLGGYTPADVDLVAGFDVDSRKVGKTLGEAAFAPPNCTEQFHTDVAEHTGPVLRGPDLDGVASHMLANPADRSFRLSEAPALSKAEIVSQLQDLRAEVMIIFLPVGSQKAVEFYVDCALEAGVAVVNGIPVFIASHPVWAEKFHAAGLPILGDDFKAQMGATILHRTLANLAEMRGVEIDRTYQLNVGGNTDFLNMSENARLSNKRESKTEAVQAAMEQRLHDNDIRIGPSDYVPWLNDRKVAYVRLEGRLFGGARTNIEVRLDVEDSPNAAAEALVAIRLARIARDRGLAGPIAEASAFLFKHPPEQIEDTDAHDVVLKFVQQGG
ncbi:inositol-3-phosphate synthase [Shimia marina]|uniref:Inositol-3-phosphate synthase n=1 Tax=Shimia marina TaxID=321267 RepID=A0A0N7LRM7_9RHOB|nr:inositol-3-phosphate synthase [Shimia marina]CUH51252.1 Inositol-3-phosphate synthase [Shimia marina]SFD53919.1 myo-inositol-1-phosphate synthase [Shimia marina]